MHSRAAILGLLACTSCLVSAAPAPPASSSKPSPLLPSTICSSSTSTTCSSSTSTTCSSSTSTPCSSSTSTPCSSSTSTPCSSSTSTSCSSSVWSPSSSSIWKPSSPPSTWSTSTVGRPSSSGITTASPSTWSTPSVGAPSSSAISTSSPSGPLSVSRSVQTSSTVPVQPVKTSESICGLSSSTSSIRPSPITASTVTAPGSTVTAPGTTVVSGTTVLCTVISGTTVYKSVTTPGPTVTAPGTTLTAPPIIHTATVISGTTKTAPPTTVISGTTVFCTVLSGTTIWHPVTTTAPGTTVTAAPTTVVSGKTVYCTVVSGTTLFQPVTAPGTTWTAPGTTVTAPPACQPSCTDSSKCNSCLPEIDIEVKVEIDEDCDEDDEQCTPSSTGHVQSRHVAARNVPGTGTVIPVNVEGVCPPGAVKVCDGALTPDTNGHCHCLYNESDGCPDGTEKQCDVSGTICACAPHKFAGSAPPREESSKGKRSVPGGGHTMPIGKNDICPPNSAKICDIKKEDCSCLFEADGCPDGKEKSCGIDGQNCACIAHANPDIYYPPVSLPLPGPPPAFVPQAIPPPAAIPQANPLPGGAAQINSPPADSKRAQENASRSTTLNKTPVTTSGKERGILHRRASDHDLQDLDEAQDGETKGEESAPPPSGCEGEKCEEEKPVSPAPSKCEGEKCEDEKPVSPAPSECEDKKCEDEGPKEPSEEDYIKLAPHDFIDDKFPPPKRRAKRSDDINDDKSSLSTREEHNDHWALQDFIDEKFPAPNGQDMEFDVTDLNHLDRRSFWQDMYEGLQPPPDPPITDQYKQKPFTAEQKFANRQKKRHEFNDCVKRKDLGQCKIEWREYESQIAKVRTCTSKRGWKICWGRYETMVHECQWHMDNYDNWCAKHRYSTAFKRQTVFDGSKTPLPEFMYDKPDDKVQYHIGDKPVDPDAAYPTKNTDHTILSADTTTSSESDTQAEPTSTPQPSDNQDSSAATTTSSGGFRETELVYTFTTLITEVLDGPAPTEDPQESGMDVTFTSVVTENAAPAPTERRRKRDGNHDENQVEAMNIVIPYPKRPLDCNLDPTAPLCQLQKRDGRKHRCLQDGGRWNHELHSCEGGITAYAPKPPRIMLATPMPVPTYRPDEADCERRRLKWSGGRCRTEDAGPPIPAVTEVPNNDVGSPAFEACEYQKLSWSNGRCMTELAGPDTPALDDMPSYPLPQSTTTTTTTMTPTTTEDSLASMTTDVSSSSDPTMHGEAFDANQHTLEKRQNNDDLSGEEICYNDGTTYYNGRCIQNDDDILIDMKGCEMDHGVWNIAHETCEHPTSSDRADLISIPIYTSLPSPYKNGQIPDNKRDCEAQGYDWYPFYNGWCKVYYGPKEDCDDDDDWCDEDDDDWDDDDDEDDDMKKKKKKMMLIRKDRRKRDGSNTDGSDADGSNADGSDADESDAYDSPDQATVREQELLRTPPVESKDTKDPARKAPLDPSKQIAYCVDEAPNRADCWDELHGQCLAWDQWWGCLEWEFDDDGLQSVVGTFGAGIQ